MRTIINVFALMQMVLALRGCGEDIYAMATHYPEGHRLRQLLMEAYSSHTRTGDLLAQVISEMPSYTEEQK